MLSIINSPVYRKQDIGGSFNYDVCGVRQPVVFDLQSRQIKLIRIDNNGIFARVYLEGNIFNYLEQVKSATNAAPQIFISDNQQGLYNYTGGFRVVENDTFNGNSLLTLKNIGDNSATFFGKKEFVSGWENQLIYKQNTILTLTFIDCTEIVGNISNGVIAVQKVALNLNGINKINIAEVALGYIPENGGRKIKVEISAVDRFGNVESTTTPEVLLVDARVPNVNFDNLIFFNPETKGVALPSTGQAVYYSEKKNRLLPFYFNFVTNSEIGKIEPLFYLEITACKKESCQGMIVEAIPIYQGLNVLDLSLNANISNFILTNKPETLTFKTKGYFYSIGEFTTEFIYGEFEVTEITKILDSGTTSIPCKLKELDDRNDFLFYFENGLGGISSMLCRDFVRIAKPEITALRNAEIISNFVSRETEQIKLSFYGLSADDFFFLTGYDLRSSQKRDGIFESKTIKRLTANGTKQKYIISGADYEVSSGQLYADLTLTIYRTLIQN